MHLSRLATAPGEKPLGAGWRIVMSPRAGMNPLQTTEVTKRVVFVQITPSHQRARQRRVLGGGERVPGRPTAYRRPLFLLLASEIPSEGSWGSFSSGGSRSQLAARGPIRPAGRAVSRFGRVLGQLASGERLVDGAAGDGNRDFFRGTPPLPTHPHVAPGAGVAGLGVPLLAGKGPGAKGPGAGGRRTEKARGRSGGGLVPGRMDLGWPTARPVGAEGAWGEYREVDGAWRVGARYGTKAHWRTSWRGRVPWEAGWE
ncbi:hypothetical protein P170DRAFT_514681 [Aspergillus steynii IBT 23096]|uniref:Uncharacterized protein n=1 Tax=Aspergillus steynii IBT 23096 TaxID=1392250 RepID=A0A2I2FQS1_9EURO|nr:hypothetical protein P170DRAFT_514698 [Aspergillus steynii IBT 23096]PLB42980.1 hypothetical protein P170DRAFT_514681 [Aspergillus steynii IBT 23096]